MLSPFETLLCFEEQGWFQWHGGEGICLPMQETRVRTLGWKDPLEEEMATCSSENPRDRGAWWATVQGVAKSQT